MATVRFPFLSRTLEISSCAENMIRIRLSDDFAPTLYERYHIYRHASEDAGEATEDGRGIRSGMLSVSADGDELCIRLPHGERRIQLFPRSDPETVRYFDEMFDGFHLPHKKILGSDLDNPEKRENFHKKPHHLILHTEGETFYGLGESNKDRLSLNGRAYMERVVYGKCEFPVPYIMTKAGYGILSNSTFWHGVDVCKKQENEVLWYFPDGELDFVIFAGDTLSALLERFTFYTGRPVLLPKWAYGLTFIDQYYADQFEVSDNAERFRRRRIPCDSISLEPGWMKKNYDRSVDKSWNEEKFSVWSWSDAEAPPYFFPIALRRYGFKLHLWLCCDYDFTACEENLAGNPTDFGFPKWFDHLRNFARDGAAGFKMDPCRHVESPNESTVFANGRAAPEMHNLIQTLYAKEMYYGAAKYRGTRPMHHYCGGYTSAGAYTATTTGDSGGGNSTLAWILNLGLSGVSNATCDMDIHNIASIHYSFFTAWCQLNSWAGYSHPWWAGEQQEAVFTFYDRLRYRLIPYAYSAAIQASRTGMPVCRAMPLVCEDEAVNDSVCQYMFGEDFLVGAFSDSVYLPAGSRYLDCWTMREYEGGQWVTPEIPQDRGGALFLRAGAIVVCDEEKQYTDCQDAAVLHLAVYPNGDSSRCFYEDDGVSQQYRQGVCAKTEFSYSEDAAADRLRIAGRQGTFDGMRTERVYRVHVFTHRSVSAVREGEQGTQIPFVQENGWLTFDTTVQLVRGTEMYIV